MIDRADKKTMDMFGTDYALGHVKREIMQKAAGNGCHCPVCDQFVKVYRRTITSTMARQLIHAYHSYGVGKFFHVRNMVLGGASSSDFPKLVYWGLIKEQYHHTGQDGKKKSGMWALTDAGRDFVNNHHRVPKHAVVYNSKLLEVTGEPVGIRDALSNKFDYGELMGHANAI